MSENKFGWRPLLVACLAVLSIYFLASGINVVIAKVYSDLNTDVGTIQLSLVLASLVSGSLMITAGKLGNKIGKKKTLILGLTVFLIGAVVALTSSNATVFILGWGLLWPLGMVLIVPTTVAMVTYYYNSANRAIAFGVYGAVASLAVTLGPLVVGFLADSISWRVAMAIAPVLSVLALIIALGIPETDKDNRIKIDTLSVILSFSGLALFLIAMLLGGTYGFLMEKRPFTIGDTVISLGGISIVTLLILMSLVLIYIFFRRSTSLIAANKEPLLNPILLKNRVYRSGLIAQTILYLTIPAIAFMLPLFLQSINSYSPSQTALAMLPGTATLSIIAFFSPPLGRKIAPKYIITAGFMVLLLATFLIDQGIGEDTGNISLTFPLIIYGVGAGLVVSQIANSTLSAAKPKEVGEASGLVETSKEAIGGGFGIALISTIVLGVWYSSFVDKQLSLEGKELSKKERTEMVIKLEDEIARSDSVETSTYYRSLPFDIQKRFVTMDYQSGKIAISRAMWVLRCFILIAIFFSLTLPKAKLE